MTFLYGLIVIVDFYYRMVNILLKTLDWDYVLEGKKGYIAKREESVITTEIPIVFFFFSIVIWLSSHPYLANTLLGFLVYQQSNKII